MQLQDTDLVRVKIDGAWHYCTGWDINHGKFSVQGLIIVRPLKERLAAGLKGVRRGQPAKK